MSLEHLTSTSEGTKWQRVLDTGEPVTLMAKDVRREKTGMHALVAVWFRNQMVANDTFNVGRDPERTRLSKSAWNSIALAGDITKTAYPLALCKRDLDTLCYFLTEEWEQSVIEIEDYDHTAAEPPAQPFALSPFLLEHAGTLLFAPPGSGKSMLAISMAVAMAGGLNGLWKPQPLKRPVLYINLERSAQSMRRREWMVRRAMGVTDAWTGVSYLQMRGHGLMPALRKAKPFIKERPDCVVILDSVSRAGLGSLSEDEVAMRFIDSMGTLNATWLALAHTPRADVSHIFGSIHFEAGADVMVRLTPETSASSVGIRLDVTKANDVKKPKPGYYVLDFSEGNLLSAIRHPETTSALQEFPDLTPNGPGDRRNRITEWLLRQPEAATQKEIAAGTGIAQGDVSSTIAKYGSMFQQIGIKNGSRVYGTATINRAEISP
jgi:hypothetical protein